MNLTDNIVKLVKERQASLGFDVDVWINSEIFTSKDTNGNTCETQGFFYVTRTRNMFRHPGFPLVPQAFLSSAALVLPPLDIDILDYINKFIRRDETTFKQTSRSGIKFIRWGLLQNREIEKIFADITPVDHYTYHVVGSPEKRRFQIYSWLTREGYVINTDLTNFIKVISGNANLTCDIESSAIECSNINIPSTIHYKSKRKCV